MLAPAGLGGRRLGSAGLVYVPVEHDAQSVALAARRSTSIAALVAALTADGVRYRNAAGEEAPLTRADLMIVAPYNAQVTALAERLPGVRIGTVDKFQGQQAPVVIVSLTTSTPEDAPRGMDFLYSANRLNVATSRAKALCILVGNPKLFEPDCRTPAADAARERVLPVPRARARGVISRAMWNPCITCGACCAYFRASFYWSEADPAAGGLTPAHLTTKLTPHHAVMRGTEQQPPRCVALHGTIGEQVRCVIHPLAAVAVPRVSSLLGRRSPQRALRPGPRRAWLAATVAAWRQSLTNPGIRDRRT